MAAAANYGNLTDGISPCKKWDDWNHRVYISSNEKGQRQTLSTMAKERIVGDTMMGVSTFFTLDMAAVRGTRSEGGGEIRHVVVFDRSARVEHFWGEVIKIMASADHRIAVIEKIKILLRENCLQYYDGHENFDPKRLCEAYIKEFQEDIDSSTSWLSNDIKFARIKKIFDEKAFTFLRLDAAEPKGFEQLKKRFLERKMVVDSIYLSNIGEYLERAPKETGSAYRQLIQRLTYGSSLVIDTWPRPYGRYSPLMQRVWCVDSIARSPGNLLTSFRAEVPPQA